MKLVTFSPPASSPRLGAVNKGERIVDLARAAQEMSLSSPCDLTDIVELIATGETGLAFAKRAANHAGHHALGEIALHAPVMRPRKNIFCVGWNYLEHFEEGAASRKPDFELPSLPTFFTKAPTTANGPFDDVPYHTGVTERLDWEVELAIIIGRQGINIPADAAMKHIYGYTVANDVSAREVQRQHGQQWFKGKSLDGSCPMGPWLVTADEIADPHNLAIECKVNGVVKQQSNTQHMYFKIPQIIEQLSAGLTLQAGDIICTGTPSGVGHARKPPEFMQAGDMMETHVAGIGTLRNRISAADRR
jgi:2-keto-4-pentenoate hydratase/2-oxohepta-3-ene-1,7-dioic acid hydratase in catechol pathway